MSLHVAAFMSYRFCPMGLHHIVMLLYSYHIFSYTQLVLDAVGPPVLSCLEKIFAFLCGIVCGELVLSHLVVVLPIILVYIIFAYTFCYQGRPRPNRHREEGNFSPRILWRVGNESVRGECDGAVAEIMENREPKTVKDKGGLCACERKL